METLSVVELYSRLSADEMARMIEFLEEEKSKILTDLMADEKSYGKTFLYHHFIRMIDSQLFLRIVVEYIMCETHGPDSHIMNVCRYRSMREYTFYTDLYSINEEGTNRLN